MVLDIAQLKSDMEAYADQADADVAFAKVFTENHPTPQNKAVVGRYIARQEAIRAAIAELETMPDWPED